MVMVALALVLAGCGGGGSASQQKAAEGEDDDGFETQLDHAEKVEFHVEPEVNTYFARTPFHAEFSAAFSNNKGELTYRWNFGDGTEDSTEQNPKHTFEKAGLFTVTLRAKDKSTGVEDGGALIVRALTEEQASAMQADYDRKGIDFKVP